MTPTASRGRAEAARGGAVSVRLSPRFFTASRRGAPPRRARSDGVDVSRAANGGAPPQRARPHRGRAALRVGMSEAANARASGAKGKRAAQLIARSRGARRRARRRSRRCRRGVPNGNTPLELFPSATMGKADDFSTTPKALEKKYIGLYTFGFKNRFG